MNTDSTGVSSNEETRMSVLSTSNDIASSKGLEGDPAASTLLEDDMSTGSYESSVRPVIAGKETKMVNLSKMLVVAVILIVAALIGYATHSFLTTQENKNYQKQFNAIANEIISITHIRSRSTFDNLEQVGASLTAQARAMNTPWPFVVFRDFQVQGMISNQITGANTLTIHPLVHDRDRGAWERFAVYNEKWLQDAHVYDEHVHPVLYERDYYPGDSGVFDESQRWNVTGIVPSIWKQGDEGQVVPLESGASDMYTPSWQQSPAVDYAPDTNKDLQSNRIFEKVIQGMLETDHPVMTEVTDATFLKENYEQRFPLEEKERPHIYLLSPIYDNLFANRTAVGFLSALFRFDLFFVNILPDTESGIIVVLDGTCGQTFTYAINGHDAVFVGPGNLRDPKYEHMRRPFEIAPFTLLEATEDETYCQYSARIYPSSEWGDKYFTDEPVNFAIAIVACFVFTSLVFVLYDCVVQKRQKVVLESATKANQVVSSLFPSNVRDRLIEEVHASETKKMQRGGKDQLMSPGKATCATSEKIFGSAPLADFFPSVTIMFADIVGFTAWSSTREPCDVFTLLETVYHAFDMIARRRRVFKVETIGDCYVAVCGLPDKREDHAVVMARFAHNTNRKMRELVQQLAGVLGPDTAGLAMRTGLHSGAVTAGVLRGDKGRFQLFGDSMNTTARIESTGERDRIHLSQETADLLIQAGMHKWVEAREDKVIAKGKGELQTFWLAISQANGSITGSSLGSGEGSNSNLDYTPNAVDTECTGQEVAVTSLQKKKHRDRLAVWCVDILSNTLKQIVAQRMSNTTVARSGKEPTVGTSPTINDVRDVLDFSMPDDNDGRRLVNPDSIVLPESVTSQLELFVAKIASLYKDNNHFHNFDHASHVTMSVVKLLSGIDNFNPHKASPDTQVGQTVALRLRNPLAQFACVLAALIHDVDHPGIGNATLIKEKHPLALRYGTSVAEQNSLNVAFQILSQPQFQDLRSTIYTTKEELELFQSALVNMVIATDIINAPLFTTRRERWEKAFSNNAVKGETLVAATDRKATLILEVLLQSADISHTMQHWQVFCKWNKRLFFEMYQAFLEGHTDVDPAVKWYENELSFFDIFVIPLAKKLDTCGVFGVAGEVCLKNANANRKEWEQNGRDTVKEYVRSYEAQLSGQ